MKKFTIILTALLLTALAATSAFAQSGVTYQVGVQIQNLDNSNAATVTVNYFSQTDGSQAGQLTETIPAGDKLDLTELTGVNAGFNGSAVVSSDREIAAIANVFGNGIGNGMGASYTAFTGGETKATLPLILRNHYGFNTWFNVQNVGSSSTNVTVTYNNGATETATIPAGAAKSFMQQNNNDLTDPPGSPGFVGSAIVTSDNQPIVATVLQQGPTTLLGYDGFRSTDASSNPVMPLVNSNNYGFITGIQIQNTGTQSSDVTVSYSASLAGEDCTETLTIPAEQSVTFALEAFRSSQSGENCADGARFVGSARVTSNSTNQPLVAIVNQLNSDTNKGAAYGGFNPANGTSAVMLPLIMDRNYGYLTSVSIVNVGSTETTVTCTYQDNSHTDSATLQAGQGITIANENKLADRYVGSASCTASGGSIVGMVNEFQASATLDSLLVYEGINQ